MLHAIVSDRPGDASVQADGNPLSGVRRSVPRDAVLLGVGLFLVVASANVLTPLLPLVQRDFAVDYTTVGLLVSAYGVARLALDLPAGVLEQRLGVPTLAGVGFALLVAASILAALGSSFELVLLGRIGMGLGTAILSVVVLTTLNELAPEGARTRVLVVYSVANNAAIGFFPVVGGILGELAFLGATDYSTFLLAALVLGLGDFFSASQAAALTESVPPRWRSRALAAYGFSVDLGAAIGPALLAGLLQVAGYRTMIAVTASLLLLAGAGALVGERAAAAPRSRG